MIGDEVMFTVDAPRRPPHRAGAGRGHPWGRRPVDLRVGMAYGPLLERESDLYGPMVNLASRITGVAFPGRSWSARAA